MSAILEYKKERLEIKANQILLIGEVWYDSEVKYRCIYIHLKDGTEEIPTDLPPFDKFWIEIENELNQTIPRNITTKSNWHQILWPLDSAGKPYWKFEEVKNEGFWKKLFHGKYYTAARLSKESEQVIPLRYR